MVDCSCVVGCGQVKGFSIFGFLRGNTGGGGCGSDVVDEDVKVVVVVEEDVNVNAEDFSMVSQLICTCDIRWLKVLVMGAKMAVREPTPPAANMAEFRRSCFSMATVACSVVGGESTQSVDLPTRLITAELLSVLLSLLASTALALLRASLFISAITRCTRVVRSIEDDRGRKVADPDMPAVAAGAFVRISSRSVELDRFLANFSMVTLCFNK